MTDNIIGVLLGVDHRLPLLWLKNEESMSVRVGIDPAICRTFLGPLLVLLSSNLRIRQSNASEVMAILLIMAKGETMALARSTIESLSPKAALDLRRPGTPRQDLST